MTTRFEGQSGIVHVPQPEGSELCFAAIVSAVSHCPIDQADSALRLSGISEADGTTPAPSEEQELTFDQSNIMITIRPFMSTETDRFIALINQRFAAKQAVAVLHKTVDDPDDIRHHWTLFTGHHLDEAGQTKKYGAMDPLKDSRTYPKPPEVEALIKRTIEYNGGVVACAFVVTLGE